MYPVLWHIFLTERMQVSHPFVLCLVQSQAQSTSKEMVDAGTEAEFEIETEKLHNQFNFNDRAVQVRITHVLRCYKIVYQLMLSYPSLTPMLFPAVAAMRQGITF